MSGVPRGAAGDAGDESGAAGVSSGGTAGSAGSAGTAGSASSAGGVGTAGSVGTVVPCEACEIAPTEIPNPCGTDDYTTDISVTGGSGNYTWSVSGTTGNWEVQVKPNSTDGSQATLRGSPSGAAQVKVTVTDGAGRTKEKLYSLTPRSACYFAYVTPDANGPKLWLRDPLLGVDATAKLANNSGVYDFQFSPDGRFLAYRYGQTPAHPHGAHLSLFDFSTMQDQTVAATGEAIDAYAWSPDAQVLAVAFSANGSSQLGGIKRAAVSGPTQITALTPVIAPNPVESNLLWVGTSFISFFSTATDDMGAPPGGFSATLYSSLGAAGFAAPLAITDTFYQPGFLAMPAPGGLFVNSPADDRSVYNSISIVNARDEDHQTNFVDPAGRFSAFVMNKALTLFKASNSTAPFENTGSSPDSNCPKLLTWALGRERLACVAHVSQASSTWGEIRIFDVGSATPFQLAPTRVNGSCLKDTNGVPLAACAQSEYDYDEVSAENQPRLLSKSGRWLAFVTGAHSGASGSLHWVDLSASPVSLSRKVTAAATTTGSPVALAFSPNERYLLHQNGNRLISHLLAAGANDSGDSEIEFELNAPVSPACAEDFATGAGRWCGGASTSPSFIWSPDTAFDVLAYRKLDKLIVVQLTRDGFKRPPPLPAPVCDAACSGQFEFQPPEP